MPEPRRGGKRRRGGFEYVRAVRFDALIVLGCSVRHGQLSPAAQRRVERAALAYHEHGPTRVLAAGGKRWHGHRECEVFARGLIERGVLAEHVVLELDSLTTRGNAAGVARLLAAEAPLTLGLVTCDWHMPRALWLFRRAGLRVTPLPAPTPSSSLRAKWWRGARERLSLALDVLRAPLFVLAALCLIGCSKPAAPHATGAPSATPSAPNGRARALLDAELKRNAAAISEDDLVAESAETRRAAVRSLARIRDERSFSALLGALADEDPDVVAWAAFGVGQLCRGHELTAASRLSVRAATLASQPNPALRAAIPSLALALGRCASDEAERSLRAWLRLEPPLAQAAALGLGEVARKRKRLDDATVAALLDGASRDASGSSYYAIESLPGLGAAARARLLEVSASAVESRGPARPFALRALARAGAAAARPLRDALTSASTTEAERADAARSLIALGADGQADLAAALESRARALIDSKDWLSPAHGVVLTLLEGAPPASSARAILTELAGLTLDGDPPPVVRRKVMLRCRAAAALAGKASASRALVACDPSPPAERREGALAQLKVLARGPLDGPRGALFRSFARSSDRVVREAALELLMAHDEVAGIPELLTEALSAPEVGVRATAAKVLARYPARAQAPSRDAASAPVDPRVVRALTAQLAEMAEHDQIELSALLMDAAASLELLGGKAAIEKACASPNPTLREHAERALQRLGERERRCPLVVGAETAAAPPEDARLVFETDVGSLGLTLNATTSPFATARLLQLVSSGFFDGMLVHRVVPGFVVQVGDPDGDGFGGPLLAPLRCETSGQPFDVGSVGIALAGRDTGLSQFFVTLRRAPHLDGDYSLVGRAEPGWERLATGDRIIKARVLEAAVK